MKQVQTNSKTECNAAALEPVKGTFCVALNGRSIVNDGFEIIRKSSFTAWRFYSKVCPHGLLERLKSIGTFVQGPWFEACTFGTRNRRANHPIIMFSNADRYSVNFTQFINTVPLYFDTIYRYESYEWASINKMKWHFPQTYVSVKFSCSHYCTTAYLNT
jgi:hypothetical protein